MHLFHLKNRNGKVILQNNQITEMSRKKRNWSYIKIECFFPDKLPHERWKSIHAAKLLHLGVHTVLLLCVGCGKPFREDKLYAPLFFEARKGLSWLSEPVPGAAEKLNLKNPNCIKSSPVLTAMTTSCWRMNRLPLPWGPVMISNIPCPVNCFWLLHRRFSACFCFLQCRHDKFNMAS